MSRPTSLHSLWPLIFMLGLFGACFTACKSSQESGRLTANKKKKPTEDALFVYHDKVRDKSSYENIQGSVPRLRAMIAGKFTQYNTQGDPEGKKYTVWKVNEGKDSVVIYHIPVGEPSKDGYWMYHYQGLTSLPDEPVFACFTQLKESNRDTIISSYYEVPEDFEAPLSQIIAQPKATFEEFDFKGLQSMNSQVCYERQTPLKYIGTSALTPMEKPRDALKYESEYYIITPERYTFSVAFYDDKKNLKQRTREELLFKEAMANLKFMQ